MARSKKAAASGSFVDFAKDSRDPALAKKQMQSLFGPAGGPAQMIIACPRGTHHPRRPLKLCHTTQR